jgi:hypothetical protein
MAVGDIIVDSNYAWNPKNPRQTSGNLRYTNKREIEMERVLSYKLRKRNNLDNRPDVSNANNRS